MPNVRLLLILLAAAFAMVIVWRARAIVALFGESQAETVAKPQSPRMPADDDTKRAAEPKPRIMAAKQAGQDGEAVRQTRSALVYRLFEQEIPEIANGVIEIKAMAREPGHRTKIAVSSNQRVDCVRACTGASGNRLKRIVDELDGERIDIICWSDDVQVLIRNALFPAESEEVILCSMLGRAIVLVREDQLSLAIGRRGQHVRLASKLCGWDIELMTREELDEQIARAVGGFGSLEGVDENLAQTLVGEGFLSYHDLSAIRRDDLMAMGGLSLERADKIVAQAKAQAAVVDAAANEERRRQCEREGMEGDVGATGDELAATSNRLGRGMRISADGKMIMGVQGGYADALPEWAFDLLYHDPLGEKHPETAAGYNEVAWSLYGHGKYAEAQPRFQKALNALHELHGDKHPDTALAYTNLGLCLQAQGKSADAQPLFQKGLNLQRELLDEKHPETARCHTGLAWSLQVQGKYAEAEPLLRKSVDLYREILGDEHRGTAAGYNNLAVNLQYQGKYAEAEPLLKKALKSWRDR